MRCYAFTQSAPSTIPLNRVDPATDSSSACGAGERDQVIGATFTEANGLGVDGLTSPHSMGHYYVTAITKRASSFTVSRCPTKRHRRQSASKISLTTACLQRITNFTGPVASAVTYGGTGSDATLSLPALVAGDTVVTLYQCSDGRSYDRHYRYSNLDNRPLHGDGASTTLPPRGNLPRYGRRNSNQYGGGSTGAIASAANATIFDTMAAHYRQCFPRQPLTPRLFSGDILDATSATSRLLPRLLVLLRQRLVSPSQPQPPARQPSLTPHRLPMPRWGNSAPLITSPRPSVMSAAFRRGWKITASISPPSTAMTQ